MDKLLSVVIPVYNGERYIFDSIMSVLNQPNKNLCVIVVDDGSTDSTINICESISKTDSRLIIIRQENAGVSAARNVGIRKSIELSASYIAFLDSDDLWCSNFYDSDIEELLDNFDYDLIGFNQYDCCGDLSRGNLYKAGEQLKRYNLCHFAAYFYSTNIFEKYSVCFPEGITYGEDLAFYYCFSTNSKNYYYIDKCILLYRNNPSSVVHKKQDIFDHYLRNSIPSWDWVEIELSKDQRSNNECETNKKLLLLQFIKEACYERYSVKSIYSIIKQNNLKKYLDADYKVWLDEKSKKEFLMFLNRPHLFWLRNRVIGIAFSFVKRFYTRFLKNNSVVLKIRYAEDIEMLSRK